MTSLHASDRAPAGQDQPPIDLVHLSRQTMGDAQLETELLGLFASQAKAIVQALARPVTAGRPNPADLLHTLCGSARAVGSWTVAEQAERLERHVRGRHAPDDRLDGLAALGSSVEQACSAIDTLLEGERA